MGVVIFFNICIVFGFLDFAATSVCEGLWNIDVVEKCENPQLYPMDVEAKKRKINRTHDGFSVRMKFDEEFTSDYMLRVESYEKCDGGYKASDILIGSACDMFNAYAKENFQQILQLAGAGTDDCPIPKGEFEISDYVINYESLPEQGKCGEYKFLAYFMKNNEKMSCIAGYTTFTRKEDDDD